MKNFKNILLFIITLMLTCIIIYVGYRSLAIAGNYFIMSDNDIKTYPMENNDSYVFYSQSDSDIMLFPWNYYADSVSFIELYPEADSKQTNILPDTDYLYSQLRYYFYKTIPGHVKESILAADGSLYEIMDFSELAGKLKVKTVSNITYYYYNEIIVISGVNYRLSFSFNDSLLLFSFQCRQIVDTDTYSADNMRLGNECLSNFINYNEQSSLYLLLLDIFRNIDYLDNYVIKYTDSNNISLNFSEEEHNPMLSDSKTVTEEYSDYEAKNASNSSYQIVETNDELLLILIDKHIVLHFDPISRMFNGFNFME